MESVPSADWSATVSVAGCANNAKSKRGRSSRHLGNWVSTIRVSGWVKVASCANDDPNLTIQHSSKLVIPKFRPDPIR